MFFNMKCISAQNKERWHMKCKNKHGYGIPDFLYMPIKDEKNQDTFRDINPRNTWR